MLIRSYRQEDFDELWRLDQECFRPGIAYSRVELLHYIRRRTALTLVAEDNTGSICGFAVAEHHARRRQSQAAFERAGHIVTIDVRERARRLGLGGSLMEALERWLRETDCDVVYLETAVDNHAAICFYKKRGYEVLRTVPRYYEGKLDALLMGKRLSPVRQSRVDSSGDRGIG